MALTLIENTLGNISPKVFDPQGHHQHVVHLTENRNEIRDDLDRTHDLEDHTDGNRFRMPWHLRVHEGPPQDPEFFENPLDGTLQLLYRWLFRLLLTGFAIDFRFRWSVFPQNAAKPNVAHAGVDHLRLASRRAVTQAVIGSAQVRTTFDDFPRNAERGPPRVVALLRRSDTWVNRRTAACLDHTENAVLEHTEAVRIAELRYRAGSMDFLSVLQLEEGQLQSQAELVKLRNNQLANRINLHLALGGSFDNSSATYPPATTAKNH